MPQPRPVHTPVEESVVLELPNGDRYHLHPQPAEFEGYLAPQRVPHLTPGIAPIKVQVTHGAAGYWVTLAPDELETLLRRAQILGIAGPSPSGASRDSCDTSRPEQRGI